MAAPDPRHVYRRTPAGTIELQGASLELSPQARRLLGLIDGHRPLSRLPLSLRPAELPIRLEELLGHGLITLAGISEPMPEGMAAHDGRDHRLDDFKRRIAGAVERELGPAGSVLEARLQDCVNLTVMRTVMREVIEKVRERAGEEPANRLAATARAAAQAWFDRDARGNV